VKPRRWFDDDIKASIKSAVQALEESSSAEIVVTVHPEGARYRHAELATGTLLAVAWLAVFLYAPEPFDFTFLPLELALAFVIGALVASAVGPWRRLLTPRAAMRREVERSAKSAFFDLGVSRSRGRTGMLVFISVFERRAILLRDAGVPALPAMSEVQALLEACVRRGAVDEIAPALARLKEGLAKALPRAADDVNELPDELVEA
jgi:putative membrane protein